MSTGSNLPLTIRQIFYRLVGACGYEKTERAYDHLVEALNKAHRARVDRACWAVIVQQFIALDTGGWRTAKPEHSRNGSVHRRRAMILIGRKSGRIAIGHGRDEVRTYSRTVVFPRTPTIYAELAMIGISAQPGFGDFSHVNSGITAVTKANGEEITFSRLRGMLRVNDATAVTFYFEALSAVATFQYSVSRWEPNPTPVG